MLFFVFVFFFIGKRERKIKKNYALVYHKKECPAYDLVEGEKTTGLSKKANKFRRQYGGGGVELLKVYGGLIDTPVIDNGGCCI